MKTYTALEAAIELDVDVSRILLICREGRLGYTLPKHGKAWVITQEEIDRYREIGPLKPGRPRKPRVKRLARVEADGNHKYI